MSVSQDSIVRFLIFDLKNKKQSYELLKKDLEQTTSCI